MKLVIAIAVRVETAVGQASGLSTTGVPRPSSLW